MFRFFINCYLIKMKNSRGLFLLALIPALSYCAAAAIQPDRFNIYQDVKIARDAPLAVADNPSDYVPVDWYLQHKDELFVDPYSVQILKRELQKELPPQGVMPTDAQLIRDIKDSMAISYQHPLLRIAYIGTDRKIGEFLSAFYAGKVMKKAEDGIKRQEMLAFRRVQEGKAPAPAAAPAEQVFELKGGLVVESDRALWRSERFPMTVTLLVAGFAIILVWIGILEMLDTSFKSERQVARFLNIPVLGMIPNLGRLPKEMNIKI